MARPSRAMGTLYFDWNATTPPLVSVLDAMRETALANWANPASVHRPGQRARAELDRARAAISALVGRHPRDVLFTSGGTEANNIALRSSRGPLVVSRLEHPSIVRVAEALEGEGRRVVWLVPEEDGRVSVARVAALLDEVGPGALVALQAVNHETGVIQPLHEVVLAAHARGATVHCDAVQAVGRLSRETWASADSVAVAAHKLRGPKGIGALVTRPGLPLAAVLRGGDQERGLRPGTQDAGLAAGFRAAATHALGGAARYAELGARRDRLEVGVIAAGAAVGMRVERNGTAERAPHVTNLSFHGARGPELCAAFDLAGLAVSSGSACSAGTAEPSTVVRAMLGRHRAEGAVRFSLGDETSEADVDGAVAIVVRVLNAWPRSKSLEGSIP